MCFCSKAISGFVRAGDDRAACMLVLRPKNDIGTMDDVCCHLYTCSISLHSLLSMMWSSYNHPSRLTTKGRPIGLSHKSPINCFICPLSKPQQHISITYYSHNRLHPYLFRSLFLPFHLFCNVTHTSSFHPLPSPTIFLLSEFVQAG